MKVAIHQPNFMPWHGFFHKLALADVFVLFDHVQFPRGKCFTSRVRIKTNAGPLWATVPVLAKGDMAPICETRIDYRQPWARKLLKTIELAYGKAAFFDPVRTMLAEILPREFPSIADLNLNLIQAFAELMGCRTKLVRSSLLLGGDTADGGTDEILRLVKACGGSVYLSGRGRGTARYISEESCRVHGIELQYMDYAPPQYSQLHGAFIDKLSILDFMANCGPDTLPRLLASQSPSPSDTSPSEGDDEEDAI
jgi:hypothetical protein